VLWVARFPREDAIIRVYHLEKSWTKAGKWSGVVGIFEILNAAEDDCNVAAWELERHLAGPPGADEAVFISLTLQYEVAMQCNTRGYPLQHDICRILSGLYYTGTNTLITVYLQCDLQTMLMHSTTATPTSPPCSGWQLTSTYVRIYHLHTKPCTRYVVQSSTYRALTHVFLSYTVYSIVISYLRCNT